VNQHPISLSEILTAPFSFEFVVLLYVYSGLYKDLPIVSGLFPIDPTVVLALGVAIWLSVIILKSKTIVTDAQSRSLFFLAVLIAFCCMSLFWTPSIVYAFEKVLYLLFISMLAFISSAIIASDIDRLRRFLLANIFLAALLVIALAIFVASSEIAQAAILAKERFYIFGLAGVYQVLSRVFAFALMSFVAGFWYFRATFSAWIVFVPILMLQLFFLLQTGGRGGLLGLMVSGAVFLVYSTTRVMRDGFRLSMSRFILLSGFAVACIVYVGYIFSTGNLPTTLARLLESEALPNTYIYGYRAHLLMQVPSLWNESPLFGSGLGSYSILMGHGDIRDYPHNVIAEILVELIIAGLLF